MRFAFLGQREIKEIIAKYTQVLGKGVAAFQGIVLPCSDLNAGAPNQAQHAPQILHITDRVAVALAGGQREHLIFGMHEEIQRSDSAIRAAIVIHDDRDLANQN